MALFQLLFIFFLLVPVLEIYLLLRIGGLIGILPTVILVVGTALLGAVMLRSQGLSTMRRLQASLVQGEIPAMEIIEGPMLLVGGALLLTPGFVTDALGFLCLIPYTRRRFAVYLLQHHVVESGLGTRPSRSKHDNGKSTTIEGEYRKED